MAGAAARSIEAAHEACIDRPMHRPPPWRQEHQGAGRTTTSADPWAREYVIRAARLRPLLTYALPVVSVQVLLELARAYLALPDPDGARAVLRQVDDIFQQRPESSACRRGARRSSAPTEWVCWAMGLRQSLPERALRAGHNYDDWKQVRWTRGGAVAAGRVAGRAGAPVTHPARALGGPPVG